MTNKTLIHGPGVRTVRACMRLAMWPISAPGGADLTNPSPCTCFAMDLGDPRSEFRYNVASEMRPSSCGSGISSGLWRWILCAETV